MAKQLKIQVFVPCTITIDKDKYPTTAESDRVLNDILKQLSLGGYQVGNGWYSYDFEPTSVKRLKKLSNIK
jgi:hypothetical protein